jgi:hypothetical protein
MRDWMRRAVQARPELAAELYRRGVFNAEEKQQLLRHDPERCANMERYSPLGPVLFATLLAQSDSQLAARAVLRNMLDSDELVWLDRLLRFQKRNGKREELCRIVERALEGRKGNVRNFR